MINGWLSPSCHFHQHISQAGTILWAEPSWSHPGLAAALTIHSDSDIGLQPGGIECPADVQAPILHGDILNDQAAAHFVHNITLVHRSPGVRVLGVTKREGQKAGKKWIIVFTLTKAASKGKQYLYQNHHISPSLK